MRYRDYSAADFANDSFFIRWVKNPDQQSEWFWSSFMKEHPDCAKEIEKAKELISSLEFVSNDLDDDELSRLRNALLLSLHAEKEQSEDDVSYIVGTLSKRRYHWFKVAAMLLLIPLFSWGVHYLVQHRNAYSGLLAGGEPGIVEQRENPVSQKSVLILGDGTKVWLNAASKISYSRDFGGKETRDVYLEGEAFFDVFHDEERPFIVHTSSLRIKVLGTSFNVKSYPEEKTIETTLIQGKVRIEAAGEHANRVGDIELKPNQRAVFDKESKVIKVKEVAAEKTGSWKVERMVFEAESIDDVILQIERWYDVKIHVDNKGRLDCKLTGSIGDESLEEVLKLVAVTHNIKYRIEGRDVYIEGGLCGQ